MSMRIITPQDAANEEGVRVQFPDGLNVYICRVPLNDQDTQLSVFINTEDMDDKDHDNGHPEMQVLLNDATLYDREPGKGYDAVEQANKGPLANGKATVTLIIDHETYEKEAGEPLTKEMLEKIAFDVNDDAVPICGYEAFKWELGKEGS